VRFFRPPWTIDVKHVHSLYFLTASAIFGIYMLYCWKHSKNFLQRYRIHLLIPKKRTCSEKTKIMHMFFIYSLGWFKKLHMTNVWSSFTVFSYSVSTKHLVGDLDMVNLLKAKMVVSLILVNFQIALKPH
jgi:hypothetical protein